MLYSQRGYGINGFVWRKVKIDYVTLLQFNVRKYLTEHGFFLVAGFYSSGTSNKRPE